jgi:hypothetical protein
MMMKALSTGGMEAVYNPVRETLNNAYSDKDYKVNSGGLFELTREEIDHPDFPDIYDGKLIKLLSGGMPFLKASDNLKRIIFMRRPIAEMTASYEAAFGSKYPHITPELNDKLDRIEAVLRKRSDVEVCRINYKDVIDDPIAAFDGLRLTGWPIDPIKCSSVIDPALYRHRV